MQRFLPRLVAAIFWQIDPVCVTVIHRERSIRSLSSDHDNNGITKGFTMNSSVLPRLIYPEDKIRLLWRSLLLEAYALIDKGISVAISREKRKLRKQPAYSEHCDTCSRANTDIPFYLLELAGITWYSIEKVLEPTGTSLGEQPSAQGKNPPCPFLLNSTCAVYTVRPIACRQFFVLGKPGATGEDPYDTRGMDILTPSQDLTDQAMFIRLPFYGITQDSDRTSAIKNNFMHCGIQNIFSCSCTTLAEKISFFDSAERKDLQESLNA